MTLEIIIIAIFASAAMLAAVLAVHNIQELHEARSELDAYENENNALNRYNDRLFAEKAELEQELEAERKNSKELRQIIIDYEIAANSQQEENQLNELEPDENEEILQANAENPMERLPDLPTNRYDTEPYNDFSSASEQYKLQKACQTERETGLRFYYDGAEKYYCAALGGAYGSMIGDTWRVTLRCGTVFNIIRADFKHALPAEPNDFGDLCQNYDKQLCMNVIEFVADFGFMTQAVKDAGGYHELECFGGKYGDGGDIVKIEYLGRRWEP